MRDISELTDNIPELGEEVESMRGISEAVLFSQNPEAVKTGITNIRNLMSYYGMDAVALKIEKGVIGIGIEAGDKVEYYAIQNAPPRYCGETVNSSDRILHFD
jgi:hypothetical protein